MTGGASIAWRIVFMVGVVLLGAPAGHFFQKGRRALKWPAQIAYWAISLLFAAALVVFVLSLYWTFS